MRTFVVLCAAAALIGSTGLANAAANAPFIDKAGNCHAANGQMAKMSVCKPAPKTGPCKDPKTGQFMACPSAQKGPCKDPKTGQFMACASTKPVAKAVPARPATPAVPASAAAKATPAKSATPAVPPKK